MADLYLRHANRYEIATPISYWWTSSEGPIHSSKGETRNISPSGVLVAAEECPPIGASIQMRMRLPSLRGTGFGMKLYGEGRVVRSERVETSLGSRASRFFAASVHFYPENSERPVVSSDEKFKSTV